MTAFSSLNLGSSPNDGTGTTLRAGGQIINDNLALTANKTESNNFSAPQGLDVASPLTEWDIDGRIMIRQGARSNPTGAASVVIDYQATAGLGGRIRSRDWDGATWKDLSIEGDDIILTPDGNLRVSTLPVYANNAAALVGGLVEGDLYKTASTGDAQVMITNAS